MEDASLPIEVEPPDEPSFGARGLPGTDAPYPDASTGRGRRRGEGEPALRERDARFRALIESSPIAIGMSRNGVALYVNPRFVEMFGFDSADEVRGMPIGQVWAPEYAEAAQEIARRRAEGLPVPAVFEGDCQRRDASRFPAYLAGTAVKLDDGLVSFVFIIDVSEQKKAEDALRESEARYRTLVETAEDVIILSDPQGRHIFRNSAYYESLGYEVGDDLGNDGLAFVHPDDVARLNVAAFDSGTRVAEYRVRHRDGHWIHRSSRSKVVSADGQPVAILSIVRDVSEQKQAEEEIRKLNAELEARVRQRTAELEDVNERLAEANERLVETNRQLEAANTAKSAFLANMSHELRTPLNSIIGFSSILGKGLAGPLSEEQSRQVSMVHSSGKHLLELIEGVLDLSRIEAGRIELEAEEIRLPAFVDELVGTMSALAEIRGLELLATVHGDVVSMRSVKTPLLQILINLMGNAIKFTEKGRVSLGVSRDGDDLLFDVCDTGCGIGEDDLPQIFEEFYQAKPATEAKTAGTGLGLSVSKRLAEALGGSIEVTSEVGEGSTFTLRIPAQAE